MRRIALVGALLVVLPVLPVQAGWLGGEGSKLPKAVRFTDSKGSETHKMAVHVLGQNRKYSNPAWGSDWSHAPKQQNRPLKRYLR